LNFKNPYLFLCVGALIFIQQYASAQSNSVLKSGDWYKIGVLTEGVYKIDFDFLNNIGLNPSSLDPRNLAIYSNGFSGMLPQGNAAPRPSGLSEHAIWIEGGDDGSFGSNDFILFYAHSPHRLTFDDQFSSFSFEKNLYSDTAYFFITVKTDAGKRIETVDPAVSETVFQTTYQKLSPHEYDLNNLLRSGRYWYGERFRDSGSVNRVSFDANGIVPGSNIEVYFSVLSQSTTASSFDFILNENGIGSIEMDPVIDATYVTKADVQSDTLVLNSDDVSNLNNGLDFDIRFDKASGFSSGYLDYLHLRTTNELNLEYAPLIFRREDNNLAFELSGAQSNSALWDVTDMVNPQAIRVSSVESKTRIQPSTEATSFVAFDPQDAPTPSFAEKISNQNIRAIGAVDALFITHTIFEQEADRLANFRMANDGLFVEVVRVDEIYNEFSSGQQDITAIRDFIRHIYGQGGQVLKFVLLFGDCSYDYKNRIGIENNFVPVYESRNSLHPINSFSTDDYFGFMEESEGDWQENLTGDHTLEIGIGRIPVKTSLEASDVVNKIIRYETSTFAYGKWRNRMAFVADDGDGNIHQNDSEQLVNIVQTARSEFNIDKIYLDAYEQIQEPGGEVSPQARQAFYQAFSNGNIIVNFVGHGNEGLLTKEKIFDEFLINDLNNRLLLPFFITATCQFGNYDNPVRISAGEQMVLKAQGGSIGLLTATRPVFSNTNFLLNKAFYEVSMIKVDGQYKRLGDMIKDTKNASLQGTRNRNYALLGDPTMRLAFPQQEVNLLTVNGKPLDVLDTLKALSKVVFTGSVSNNGNLTSDFNGIATVAVYDKPSEFQTLGNENTARQTFELQDVLLFQGEATVTNGLFDIEFIVPKNITYTFGEGKISMYAINSNANLDAHGGYNQIIVGGSADNPVADNTPPQINLYLNDTTFASGDQIGPDPVLLAKLFDESGINISKTGFGTDITIQLDDDEPLVINEFYTAEIDSYQQGWVAYPLANIDKGWHTLLFTVFDIHNNQSRSEVAFYITDDNSIQVTQVVNYPNPLQAQTTFTFTHDRPGEVLNVMLSIINLQGQEIIRNTYRFEDSPQKIDNIEWRGTDASGNRVKKGIYIYRILIQSELDGSKSETFNKLVVSD